MNTFTNETGNIGKTLLKARQDIPALVFVMPFVKTPVNIARYTFERSPFAPLVGQWRADIAAGGARADLAIARMSIGTMIMAHAFGLADSGRISGKGPRDPGERESMQRQGWQEYSIQLGGKWYSYNRLDPYGALMGFSADVAEAVRHGEFNEDDVDDWGEITAMGVSAVSQVAISKTYLKGMSDTFHAVTGNQREIEGYLNNFASSFIPYTSLAGTIERASDPILRETNSPWEAVQAKLKGLSDQLPPKMDLWGRPRTSASGVGMDYDVSPEAQKRITQTYDALSPMKATRIDPEPIDTEIMRLAPLAGKDNVEGSAPQRIAKNTTFDGVQVSFKKWRDVYVEYVKLAGNDLKDPAFGLGCKDYLNAMVTGKHPQSVMYEKYMSDETKIKFINSTVNRYRKMAQHQILEDPKYIEFADNVRAIQETKRAALMPPRVQ
jgi:hypothetical protein